MACDAKTATEACGTDQRDNWAGRRTRMLCRSCIFFVLKPEPTLNRINDVGRCRRHAPVVQLGYPPTFATDWCGDFKLDENKR